MLMRVQVRPLLPSRGIPWLLQLGMAPCRGHWCLCCAECSSGGAKGVHRLQKLVQAPNPRTEPYTELFSPSRRSKISKIR